ncbi:MAG: phosphoribosylformylglycinamidine cyclo-ligase [Nitrospinae bacterium]|nr:phosphoribosylformylglycinamidine cyclo-ligase [Nitrospinota bacterium]
MNEKITYKTSGVDIDAGAESLNRIKAAARSTHNPSVLTGLGTFGSLFDLGPALKNYREPVMVQSVDGVGTKLMVAAMADKHDTVGADLVNHSLNDILCQGAKGITFLDYIAVEKLAPEHIEQLVTGMASACRAAGLALVGGETAELPGVYVRGEYDLAGLITGVVEKSKIITGATIAPGDVILGLASSGLHTNGYTMARKVFFDRLKMKVDTHVPELGRTVGEELLAPHRDYSRVLWPLLQTYPVKGLAHITGGGLIDNLPRILPSKVDAKINISAWEVPPVFRIIAQTSGAPEREMFRAFNMGIGMVIVIEGAHATALTHDLCAGGEKVFALGEIVPGTGVTRLV